MPQAPLPPLAARLVPQNLITPMHAGQSTPQDVIQHQWQVDYLDKAKKGAELGSMIAQLPTVGAQNVLERSYAHLATERAKALQDEIKQINTQYPGPENAQRRSMAVEDAMIRYGYKQTGTQGGFDTQVPLGVYGKDYFINRAYNNPPPAPVQPQPKGNVEVGEVTRTDGTNTNTADQDSLYKSRAAQRLNTQDLNDPRIPAMVEQLKAEDAKAKNANPNPSPSPLPSPSPTPNQPGFKIPHSGGQSAMLFNPANNGNGIQLASNTGFPAAPIMGYPQVQGVAYPTFPPYNYNTEGAVYPNAPLA